MKIGKIEKNVEIPLMRTKTKYPWPDMEVGDSVLIYLEEGKSLAGFRRKTSNLAHYYGYLTDKKFKSRIDHSKNGVLVWRIE